MLKVCLGILRVFGRISFDGDGVIPLILMSSSSYVTCFSVSCAVKRGLSAIVFDGLITLEVFVIGMAYANSGSVSMLTLLNPSGFTRKISAWARKLLSNCLFTGNWGRACAASAFFLICF